MSALDELEPTNQGELGATVDIATEPPGAGALRLVSHEHDATSKLSIPEAFDAVALPDGVLATVIDTDSGAIASAMAPGQMDTIVDPDALRDNTDAQEVMQHVTRVFAEVRYAEVPRPTEPVEQRLQPELRSAARILRSTESSTPPGCRILAPVGTGGMAEIRVAIHTGSGLA